MTYQYHIEQEIYEQPEVLARLLQEGSSTAHQIARAIRDFNPTFVMIAARGTSDNAGRYAQYLMGIHARLPVELATPSIHTLYEVAPHLERALVIGISQSGQSEDVCRVLTDARSQGALTLAITNTDTSPLVEAAEFHMPLNAGEEISVAATKTYTAQLTAVAMLVGALIDNTEFSDSLANIPAYAAEVLELQSPNLAERYRYMNHYAIIGRGYNYCTVFEVSLKIKELCYVTGTEYSEADFLHGPIAMIQPGFPVIAIAPSGKTLPLMVDLLEKLRSRNAECLVISNDELALNYATKMLRIPAGIPEWLSPIIAVIPGQVFATNLALAKGNSVDKPTGLKKITSTM